MLCTDFSSCHMDAACTGAPVLEDPPHRLSVPGSLLPVATAVATSARFLLVANPQQVGEHLGMCAMDHVGVSAGVLGGNMAASVLGVQLPFQVPFVLVEHLNRGWDA